VVEFLVAGTYRVDADELIGAFNSLGPRKNWIRNGDFQIAQEGDGPFNVSGYTVDMWYMYLSGATAAVQRFQDSSGLAAAGGGMRNYLRYDVTGADDYWQLWQYIENVWTLQAKTCTLSFFAYVDAGLILEIEILQRFDSVEPDVTAFTTQLVGSGGWVKYTYTFDIPTVQGKILGTNHCLQLRLLSTTTQSGRFYLAEVQLEEGSKATPFERRSYGEELALCQRYFLLIPSLFGACVGTYGYQSNTILFPVTMRANPTFAYDTFQDIDSAGITFSDMDASNTGVERVILNNATDGKRWNFLNARFDARL
jgi:hypothetical protein